MSVVVACRQARLCAAIGVCGLVLALVAVPARAAFTGRNGNVAWSYSIGPDPGQSGSVGVLLSTPTTGHHKNVQQCDYAYDGDVFCPTWSSVSFSPNGGRTLWVTGPGVGGQVSGEQTITVMNADFSAPMPIKHPGENDTQASFSPDGKGIVYVRTIHGHSQVVTSGLTGENVRVLGGLPSHARSPELFPSGRRILVTNNTTIWSALSDGRQAQPLIPNGSAPDISPDGRSIAYIGVKSGAIYLARADGTHRHKVSLQGALCRPPRCSGSAQAVVFSPDGTKLAFAWNSDPSGSGDPTLYTVRAAGGRIKQIASLFTDNAGGDTTGLSWQPVH